MADHVKVSDRVIDSVRLADNDGVSVGVPMVTLGDGVSESEEVIDNDAVDESRSEAENVTFTDKLCVSSSVCVLDCVVERDAVNSVVTDGEPD